MAMNNKHTQTFLTMHTRCCSILFAVCFIYMYTVYYNYNIELTWFTIQCVRIFGNCKTLFDSIRAV